MKISNIIKSALFFIFNLFIFPIVIFLNIVTLFKKIKFPVIIDTRIGHLALNTDIFLRQLKLKLKDTNIMYIYLASTNPANKQLMTIIERQIKVYKLPLLITRAISSPYSLLNKTGYVENLDYNVNEYLEMNVGENNFTFTEEEEKKGQDSLKEMGVNNWYICFHSRDDAYLGKDNIQQHNGYRNCSIINYVRAAEYITQKNGFAIRMGYKVLEKIKTNNPKIIDYASRYRTDFLDVYLPSHCKFFLSSSAGLLCISEIFNIPIAAANYVPMQTPFKEHDLFIPKKIFSKKFKRLLTFKEIFDFHYDTFFSTHQYIENGLTCIENSEEEILDLAIEMNERLDGIWKDTYEDELLQKKFKGLFKKSRSYNFPCRCGTMFLRKNRDLL